MAFLLNLSLSFVYFIPPKYHKNRGFPVGIHSFRAHIALVAVLQVFGSSEALDQKVKS